MRVEELINGILDREGEKYTNDPADSGGPTKWGITQSTLSKYRGTPATPLDVAALTRAQAYAIYLKLYYTAPGFDKVANLSPKIAEELTDTGVNCGVGIAGEMLQRALNVLNLEGTKYPDLKIDGDCGAKTLAALDSYLKWRGAEGEKVLLRALNCLQGERYISLAERRPKDERFVYGWLKERVA